MHEYVIGPTPTADDEVINITLVPERVACPRHGEPFRSMWPGGFDEFSVAALAVLLEGDFSDQFQTTEAIEAELDRSPICEHLSKNVLLGLYTTSEVKIQGTCENCGKTGFGTPYSYRLPNSTVHYTHLCFTCIVYAMKPLN